MKLKYFSLLILLTVMTSTLYAQSSKTNRKYHITRYQDDFSFLHNDSLKADFFDPIKYVSFGPSNFLSFGGEIRHQYQLFQHPRWKNTPDKNGHFLQRYMFHGDLHLGKYFRFFGQLNAGFINGRTTGPRPAIDRNALEVNQFFVTLKLIPKTGIRIGRMEEKMGTARLIAPREGQNVRRSFEGIHAFWLPNKWRIDAFVLQEVISKPELFDDFRNKNKQLIGLYTYHKNQAGVHLAPYFLAHHFKQRLDAPWRFSPGIRMHQKNKNGLSWNLETTVQWTRLDKKPITNSLLAGDGQYLFRKVKHQPFIGVGFSSATGDKKNLSKGSNTFDSFYPKPILGQAIALSPSNITQFYVKVGVQLNHQFRVSLSHDQLFRSHSTDVFYLPSGKAVIPAQLNMNSKKHIGHHTKLVVKFKPGIHYFVIMEYAIIPPGRFLQELGRTSTLQYGSIKSVFRF